MTPVQQFLLLLCCHFMLVLVVARGGGECPDSFECGYIGSITFPFTTTERPDCGLFPIHHCSDPPETPRLIQFQNNGKLFVVLREPLVSPTKTTVHVRDIDFYNLLQSRNCGAFRKSYTLPPILHFGSLSVEYNTTLFWCNRSHHVSAPVYMHNYTGCPDYDLYYNPFVRDGNQSALPACTKVLLPIKDVPDAEDPFTVVTADVLVQVYLSEECAHCHYKKRRQCRLDSQSKFYCDNDSHEKRGKTVLIITTASSVVVALLLILACCLRMKLLTRTNRNLFGNKYIQTDEKTIQLFLEQYGSLPTRRYSYSEIKKFTNNFIVKLGQGGYGSVYKGNLQDGSLVAVKVFSQVEGTGEEFINEVASISRTSHVNIVTLVGFCFQGSKRALIYEFMSNGSLEKFIYEENPAISGRQLDCKTLYDIVIGVARGLYYLHRGCNTKILHFDIKPHNILLDEDFCPKISDFGLAKICPRKESMVSMMCARGTIGYIAPEVFSRNFGGVSHKADVYSYGMMVLEMVGGKHNKNVQVDCSSELYFPHWIYKRLELDQDFGLLCIKNESDRVTVRKMIVVSLWCIQTDPSCRPSMNKVVEMLEGSLESLILPPKPFLDASPTSPTHYSSQTSATL